MDMLCYATVWMGPSSAAVTDDEDVTVVDAAALLIPHSASQHLTVLSPVFCTAVCSN